MEFETLKRSHLKRNILIAVVIVLVISAIILNFTRARYRITESIPLVNGKINYTLPDLNIMALYINGEEAEELDSSKNYRLDTSKSTCTYKDGSTISNLSLSYDSSTKSFSISPYTTKGTKCTLYFEESRSAVDIIEGLYENNQDILAYDGTTDNNLRYIGADPANYVYFNCDDYSNPSSSTCELWRIIGVMNNMETDDANQSLVKLIRNESLGNIAWDSGRSNDWSEAGLQETLNGDYLKRTGDYSTTGITDATRDMIENVTWKLGGRSNSSATAATFYTAERGTTVYSGNPTEWKGKIALMYPSDYGYATSGGRTGRDTCLSYNLGSWNSYSDCYNNDWLYTGAHQWTLTPRSSHSYTVFYVDSPGYVGNSYANDSLGVRPSVYLTSEVRISGGDGTANNAYTLEV